MSAQRIDDDRKHKPAADVLRPDLCVIGAGEAGLSAALDAAALGASVILVEHAAFGGAHLRGGCISSKALVAAAARAQTIREAAAFGLNASEPQVDFAALRSRIAAISAELALARSPERLVASGVRVLRAQARFLDRLTLVAGEATIQARRFVVATGGRPARPDIPGLAGTPHLTSDTIFDLPERPDSLVVLGGGPLGLELAQAFRRLGSRVVVIERHVLLPREDRELAACVEARLRAEGVDIRIGARVASIEGDADGVRLRLEPAGESEPAAVVTGARLLVATGRAPFLDGLDLERAGVRAEPSGIVVDARMRAANRRIYAIGDCAGAGGQGYRFSHAARRQAEIVVADALGRGRKGFELRLAPRVTFTDPEIAAVGEGEDEARAGGKDARKSRVRVLRLPFAINERARIEGRLDGLMKLVLAPDGRVLGCAIAGRGAGEMIAFWTLVVSRGLRLSDLDGLVAPNPTLSELSLEAARAAVASAQARGEGPRPGALPALRRAFGRIGAVLRKPG